MKNHAPTINRRSPQLYNPSAGVSGEANTVATMLCEVDKHALSSVSLGKEKTEGLNRLYTILCETSQPDWDSYGASRTSYDSYLKAEQFLKALPPGIPAPEVAVDPDGEVSLEWYRGPKYLFSVSLGTADELSYAGIFRGADTHGREIFTSEIPETILAGIQRVLS